MRKIVGMAAFFVGGWAATGCADWDNPAALSELNPQAGFQVATTRVETFEEVEIRVQVTDDGTPLELQSGRMEIEHEASGSRWTVEAEPAGEDYVTRVTFFEPGRYHLSFEGMPDGHRLMWEMGEQELEVSRQHRVIGAYWVELDLDPAPVLEGGLAHVHVFVYDLLGDGTRGQPVGGLQVGAQIHDPAGVETVLGVTEEVAGDYTAEYVFVDSGLYELHVSIAGQTDEFHFPVLPLVSDDGTGGGDHQGGGGHGH